MNKYLYSAETNSFYPYALKDSYIASGTWPNAGVDVNEAEFVKFINPPEGKKLVADAEGKPSFEDIPPPTVEQLVQAAEIDKTARISAANNYINAKQWPSKLAMGRLSYTEKQTFNLWLDYLDALYSVDTSTAPAITWPEQPQ